LGTRILKIEKAKPKNDEESKIPHQP